MNYLRKLFIISILCSLCLPAFMVEAQSEVNVSARIAEFDPGAGVILANREKLYLQVFYESNIPLRFQATALRRGVKLEFGANRSSPTLHTAGKGQALVWVYFSNATSIDEVMVTILDTEWQELDQFGGAIDMTWQTAQAEQLREPAGWVKSLIRKERHKQEFVFDPAPQQKETVFDVFFLIAVLTIPIYLFLQIQFLRHFRGRWRELSAIPIISIIPMVVVSLFGFEMEFRLWVVFVFRGMPLALIYLMILWVAKQISEKKRLTR